MIKILFILSFIIFSGMINTNVITNDKEIIEGHLPTYEIDEIAKEYNQFVLQLNQYENGEIIHSEDYYRLIPSKNYNFTISGEGDVFYYEFDEGAPIENVSIYLQYKDDVDEFLSDLNRNYVDKRWLRKNNMKIFYGEAPYEDELGSGCLYLCTYNSRKEYPDILEVWLKCSDNALLNVTFYADNIDLYDAVCYYQELLDKVISRIERL